MNEKEEDPSSLKELLNSIHRMDKKLKFDSLLSEDKDFEEFEDEEATNQLLIGERENESKSTITRVETSYKYHKDRFAEHLDISSKNTTNLQFNSLYTSRLEKLGAVLKLQIEEKYPDYLDNLQKILQIKPGDESIIIGTIYKEMELKPSILKQYAQSRDLQLPQTPALMDSYVGEKDSLVFEDETGRVKLVGKTFDVNSLLTGLNVAIFGKGLPNAEFEVKEIIYPGVPPQPYLKESEELEDDTYVCLISGISIGNPNATLLLNLFTDYITGNLGSPIDQKFVSRIARVIIAGNSIQKEDSPVESFMKYKSKQEILEKQKKMSLPIKDLDIFLSEICQSVPVDILPGSSDPTNYSLPQHPFNPCLLPFSVQNSNINLVTNPYESEIGGRIFLGTAGQNIDNASRYINITDKSKIIERTLLWRHIAPTAPDTLACTSLDHDIFVIEQCPHFYFIGNQDRFDSHLIEGQHGELTRVIQIPRFSETGTIVLVNLKTLEAFPVEFDTNSYFPDQLSGESKSQYQNGLLYLTPIRIIWVTSSSSSSSLKPTALGLNHENTIDVIPSNPSGLKTLSSSPKIQITLSKQSIKLSFHNGKRDEFLKVYKEYINHRREELKRIALQQQQQQQQHYNSPPPSYYQHQQQQQYNSSPPSYYQHQQQQYQQQQYNSPYPQQPDQYQQYQQQYQQYRQQSPLPPPTQSNRSDPNFNTSNAGISGLIKNINKKSEETDKVLAEAFTDLSALMDKAKDMVKLSERLKLTLDKQSKDSTSTPEEEEFRTFLLQMGIESPVTKKTAKSKYHDELSKQLSEWILTKQILQKQGSSTMNINSGMIPLGDLYCIFNRARGIELISPDDLYRACLLFEQLDLPLRLRKFDSGVMVVQSIHENDEQVAKEIIDIITIKGAITAFDLAKIQNISINLSKEKLLASEKTGKLCRDETIEGITFHKNFFLEF
eukprot:gene5331-6649_t